MKAASNIIAISAIRTHEADTDWSDLCRIKDTYSCIAGTNTVSSIAVANTCHGRLLHKCW